MSWANRRELIKMALTVAWLVLTVAFAFWWFTFSLNHINQLAELQPDRLEHWERQRRMVLWEGSSWLFLLALGGAALIGLVQREKMRNKRIREFFASFSHEVKTSLSSLRVQAEALQDDLGNSPIMDRLVGDTVRLQLQLENSLFLASQKGLSFFIQPLKFSVLLERMREQWPNLRFELTGDGTIMADERALRTVLSNLVQNSHVHGKAKIISIDIASSGKGHLDISVRDDGLGFNGPVDKLGELFLRHKNTSGSGLGLYIGRMLLRKMGGDIHFVPSAKGFHAVLTVVGGPA